MGVRRSRSRLANDAWEALLTAHATLMRRFGSAGLWSEVSMREYDVLYTVAKQERPVRVGELTRRVLLSQPALSRMIDRLVQRGLLDRLPDSADRRGTCVVLTDEGRRVQREIGRQHARDVAEAMTNELTDEEMETLEAISLKLARHGRSRRAEQKTRHTELNAETRER